jgi:hypothetical protein
MMVAGPRLGTLLGTLQPVAEATCIVIEVSEDAVLPYESLEADAGYRQFSLPAEVANQYERRAVVTG